MELNLGNTVRLITIITFTAWLVKFLIVKPLQTAITALKEAITEMKNMMFRMEQDQKSIEKGLLPWNNASRLTFG
jgi:hypothetical protein